MDEPASKELINPPVAKYLRRSVTIGLQVAGIAKRYGATLALDGVDLAVRPGEVHALLGENGAGKSTLMNVLVRRRAARSRRDARSTARAYAPSAPSDARRRGVALIHQELSLCPHLSVTDNVLLGNEVSHRGWIDRSAASARARALLDELPHPEIHPDKRLARPLAAGAADRRDLSRARGAMRACC